MIDITILALEVLTLFWVFQVMLERRTLYDDARGMGEGIVDNRKTISRYILLIENIVETKESNRPPAKRFDNPEDIIRSFNVPTDPIDAPKREDFTRPSLYATHLSNSLNYPSNVFIIDHEYQKNVTRSIKLVNRQFPCDTHLVTLRSQPDAIYSQFPSSSALMVLHRQGYDCAVHGKYTCDVRSFAKDFRFEFVNVKELELRSLTGLDGLGVVKSFGDIFVEPMSLKTINITLG